LSFYHLRQSKLENFNFLVCLFLLKTTQIKRLSFVSFDSLLIWEKSLKKNLNIEILSIDDEVQPKSKVLKKYSLSSNYKWTRYGNVYKRVNNLSDGPLSLGLKSNDKIVLFAETRPEWLVSDFACIRIKVPAVNTLFNSV